MLATVVWEDLLNGHPFTGMYKGGPGLMRLSEGNFFVPEADGLTPAMALKFPRDGMQSVNHLAQSGWSSTGSWNFFETNDFFNDFKIKLEEFPDGCEEATIEQKFREVSFFVTSVGQAEFARVQTDGTVESDPVFPILGRLKFRPHPGVASMFPAEG